ncbi:hypothetical protein XPA_010542 [Xanthoria parietina]
MEDLKLARGAGYFARLCVNYGVSTVMLVQQLCGISIISFYSSSIFRNVDCTAEQALYTSLGHGAIHVVFTVPILFLIDTRGQRVLKNIIEIDLPRTCKLCCGTQRAPKSMRNLRSLQPVGGSATEHGFPTAEILKIGSIYRKYPARWSYSKQRFAKTRRDSLC